MTEKPVRHKVMVFDYTYHPVPIAIFDTEEEAQEWVDVHSSLKRSMICCFEDHCTYNEEGDR